LDIIAEDLLQYVCRILQQGEGAYFHYLTLHPLLSSWGWLWEW